MSAAHLARILWLRVWFVLPVVAGLLACRAHLGFELVSDARFLILENRYLDGLGHLWGNLRHDYFWSSSGNAIPYFRPLTKGSWLLEATLFGKRAFVFHAVQVAWFALAIGGVARLGRELGLQRRFAATAATLFALHPATAEPTSLIMARSDVVATACIVWALAMFAAHRRSGRRGALVAHSLFVALALSSKESAIVVAPLVTLAGVLDRRSGLVRAVSPAWSLAIGYLVVRRLALGPLARTELTFDPLRVFAGLGHSVWALLHLGPTTGLRSLPRAEATSAPAIAISLLGCALAGLAAALGLRERRRASTLLAALALAALLTVLLPRSMWVPNVEGKIPLADRWLLPAVAAFSLLVARAMQRCLRGRAAHAGLIVFGGWAAMATLWSGVVHADYRSEDSLLALEQRAFDETPAEHRTPLDRCRAHDRGIVAALRRSDARLALTLDDARARECPLAASAQLNRLAALTMLGRWAEAAPIANGLLADGTVEARERAPLAFYAGLVALETADAARAERLFADAATYGYSSCLLPLHAARAAMALQRPGDAAQRLEAAFDCAARAGKPDRKLLVAAAALYDEAGRGGDAARVRAKLAPH